ncbi:MAG TPA: hypothetical protein VEZ11_07400 [Thermoanaerobaculia bacterium]|nr:hypothetical protein [Thermoanaerobaculia bacterium]
MSCIPRNDTELQGGGASIAGDAMGEPFAARHLTAWDPILHPLIRERNELRREKLLERILVEHLDGIIRRALQRRVSRLPSGRSVAVSVDDVRSTVFLRLLKRLRTLSENGPIQNLAGYATTVTLNAWEDSLREAFPQRTLLKNRIRYVLQRDERFALWLAAEQTVSGFAEWRGRTAGAAEAPDAGDLRSRCGNTASLRDVLLTLFGVAGAPVELDAVVTTVGRVSGIADEPAMGAGSPEWSEAPVAAGETEDREILRKLWDEIVALNLPQRVAFLLNLRDDTGDAATPLFVTTGIVSIEEIAETLAMPARDFAARWNDLPIEDAVIARILGVTRQQVINLRSAARKRLARRMKKF